MGIVLTHSAKYKPMSFEDMIKPYVMATEEYRKLESGIADLEAQAESVKQQALLEPEGSKTRKQYEDYAAKLDQAATDLASRGLKGVNRKSILDLSTQYKSNIKPIEDLIKYRKDIAEEQRKLDPKYVVDRDFSQVTLDELMSNPNLGYNRYDLEDYGKQAILEGTSIKSQMNPTYLGKDPSGQNLLYSQGMSDDDLQAWLAGASNEELDTAVDRIAGNAPQAVRDRVKTDLAKSLRATVSKETNRGYETPAQINSRIKSDNAVTAKMIADGFMEGKGGKWIPDPDSPVWVTKGVKYEYVKDENGTIQKDAYDNPIVKASAGIKPGTANTSGKTQEEKDKAAEIQRIKDKEERKRWAVKEGFQTDEEGFLIPVDPNDPSKGYKKIDNTEVAKDKNGIPLQPMILDKAKWLPGWSKAGFVGDDGSGFLNWIDTKRKTRDWGADYTLKGFKKSPNSFERITNISTEEYREALEKFKEKEGESFKAENYDFYKTIDGEEEGIIALPKGYAKSMNITLPSEVIDNI